MSAPRNKRKVKNPFTGRMVYANGQTAKKMRKGISNLNQESISYKKTKENTKISLKVYSVALKETRDQALSQ